MTDKLIDSFDIGSNITVNYKNIAGDEHPCIVDISACVDIKDMLIEIENFRTSNYNSENVDAITSFNTENCIEVSSNVPGNSTKIQKRGYFDFNSLGDTSNITYYSNLYIGGELIVQSNITAYSTMQFLSDSNLKYDIYKIEDSLENIEKLRPVSFTWKHNNEQEIGFIANELEEIFPGLIKEREYKMIKENKLIPYLVDSIKTLKNRIRQRLGLNYVYMGWPGTQLGDSNRDVFRLLGMPNVTRSDNNPLEVQGTILLDRFNARCLRPGMTIFLDLDKGENGTSYFNGYYLINSVSFEHYGTAPVTVGFRSPERLEKDIPSIAIGPTGDIRKNTTLGIQ